jgi:transcriptional regulator GlxA family with amidase domain
MGPRVTALVLETETSPMAWLTDARLDRARELLELTDEPVENLGRLTGLGSPASVRAIFHAAWAPHPTSTGRCSDIDRCHRAGRARARRAAA